MNFEMRSIWYDIAPLCPSRFSQADIVRRDLESAEHEEAMRLRHMSVVNAEVRQRRKEGLAIQDQILSVQEQLYEGNRKMTAFKGQIHVNQEQLDKWSRANKDKLADEEALMQYSTGDSLKLRELRARLSQASSKRASVRAALDEAHAENQGVRIELENVVEQLKSAKREKVSEQSELEIKVSRIRETDEELQRLGAQYVEAATVLNERQQKSVSLKSQLESLSKDNAKKRMELAAAERELVRLRADVQRTNEDVESFTNELESSRGELRAASNELATHASLLDSAMGAVERTRMQLESLRLKLASEQDRHDAIKQGKLSKEREAAEAQNLLEAVFAEAGELEKQIKTAKDSVLYESSFLVHLREIERKLLLERSGLDTAARQVPARAKRAQVEQSKLREEIYALDFELEMSKRRFGSISGQISTQSEKDELTRRVGELETQTKEARSVCGILAAQLKRQDTELKAQRRVADQRTADLRAANCQFGELEVEIESLDRADGEADRTTNELLVSRDELQASLNSKRDSLAVQISDFFEAQNEYSQIVESVAVNARDVAVRVEELQTTNRQLHEQRRILALRVGEGRIKIAQVQVKYDHLVKRRIGGGEDDIHSQARAVVQAAQEREELIQTADQLESKIKTAESEIRAMEFAAKQLQVSNTSFANHLKSPTVSSSASDLGVLDTRLRDITVAANAKRRSLDEELKAVQSGEAQLAKHTLQRNGVEVRLETARSSLADAGVDVTSRLKEFEEVQTEFELVKTGIDRETLMGLCVTCVGQGLKRLKETVNTELVAMPALLADLKRGLLIKGVHM